MRPHRMLLLTSLGLFACSSSSPSGPGDGGSLTQPRVELVSPANGLTVGPNPQLIAAIDS